HAPVACFSLSISLARPHRALHSFPTRRSSDLPLRPALRGPPPDKPLDHPADGPRDPPAAVHRPRLLCVAFARAPVDGGGGRCTRDRKSTRLNSSHGSISYAVFCLKKKKI